MYICRCDWLPVEIEDIRNKFKSHTCHDKRSRSSMKQHSKASLSLHVNSGGYVKKGRGLPWRTAARKVQRWLGVILRNIGVHSYTYIL